MVGGKKPKRGPFNGFGTLYIGSGNLGMKMKKCLKIGLPNLKSISGNFVNDLIEVSDILFLVCLHFEELKYSFLINPQDVI